MNRPSAWFVIGILAVAVGASALRLPRLALRPMHGDEANQAAKAGILFETGVYRYDPEEHHGPSLYYLTLPSWWLSSARTFAETDEVLFRIVPVVFGIAGILLLALVGDGLGRAAAVVAGALAAISPAMVYFSRYYIQETLLVFFTFAAIACGWRYVRGKSVAWAAAAGAAVGLMHATKETWVLAGAAMAAGLALTILWTRWRDGASPAIREWLRPRRAGLAAASGAAVVVAAVLFSSFGANPRGPLDSILAYVTYSGRAGGEGLHAHPWYFYLQMLIADRPARGFFWTEGLIVGLALAGAVAALMRGGLPAGHRPLARFLAFYTIVLTALYAAIPYKTPWCMLSFLHGMILLAGVGAVAIVRLMRLLPLRMAACVVLAAAAVHLGRQSYLLNYRFYADQRNPLFYAHTSTDLLNLAEQMERLARAAPHGRDMMIHVVTPENYWPLPWYLRRFNQDHVGYWHDAAAWAADVQRLPPPAVVILSPDVQPAVDAALKGQYNRQSIYGLRPAVLLSVYVRQDIWDAMLAQQASLQDRRGPGGGGP
ncbi:MAG: TIGR03663 family protein [Planctomycetes bacterium]|nr:TIGR03663 family protein [Planctomycetota bacterium]